MYVGKYANKGRYIKSLFWERFSFSFLRQWRPHRVPLYLSFHRFTTIETLTRVQNVQSHRLCNFVDQWIQHLHVYKWILNQGKHDVHTPQQGRKGFLTNPLYVPITHSLLLIANSVGEKNVIRHFIQSLSKKMWLCKLHSPGSRVCLRGLAPATLTSSCSPWTNTLSWQIINYKDVCVTLNGILCFL